MKRLSMLILISILVASGLFAEVSQKALTTSFTAEGECFIGFCSRNVTNTIKVPDANVYKEGATIGFTFDAVYGNYYTSVFYAYCQSFINKALTVTVSAPAKIRDENNSVLIDTFNYQLVYDSKIYDSKTGLVKEEENNQNSKVAEPPAATTPAGPKISGPWETDGTTIKFVHNESNDNAVDVTVPRVVMSQPIQIRIKDSQDITRPGKYSITFTLKVAVNE